MTPSAAIREALSRLMAADLLVAEDQRGFRASPLSIPDLMDLTQTRIEIETLALRRSMQNGDAAWRESVTLAWRALQAIPRTLAHDRGAHNEARLERLIDRPTLVSFKFVPTYKADIAPWYRLVRWRKAVFERDCGRIAEHPADYERSHPRTGGGV